MVGLVGLLYDVFGRILIVAPPAASPEEVEGAVSVKVRLVDKLAVALELLASYLLESAQMPVDLAVFELVLRLGPDRLFRRNEVIDFVELVQECGHFVVSLDDPTFGIADDFLHAILQLLADLAHFPLHCLLFEGPLEIVADLASD